MPKPKRIKPPEIQYPVCIRHNQARKDVRLRHCFLCDHCAARWKEEAFAGQGSLYDGERMEGYCLLCNQRQAVRLRTWFLCDICWRVAASIGRNHIAEQAIVDWWEAKITPHHPYLSLLRNDVAALRPRRQTDISGESQIDFLVIDKRSDTKVLAVENKTGRSSISAMSAFQLDLSDCDCIIHTVRELQIPAILIHAQVLELWTPPTSGFQCTGLWWSDMFSLAKHFTKTQMRRDENRGAAYFSKKAFREIDQLPAALFSSNGSLALVDQFQAVGIPRLYRET